MKKYSNEITKLYIALMFTLLPLIYDDNYNGILDVKTQTIYNLAIGFVVMMLPAICILAYKKELGVSRMTITEILLIGFTVTAVVASIASKNIEASVTGMESWRVGSIMILTCTVIYLLISEFFDSSKMDIWKFLYCGFGAIVVFSVLDRLGIDLFDMFQSVVWEYDIFTSTIGNVDFYATTVSLFAPIFMILPIKERSRFFRMLIYILMYLVFVNMYIILANSIFLGVGAGIVFVIFYSLLDYRRLSNLAKLGILFGLAGVTVRVIDVKWPYRSVDRDAVVATILRWNVDIVVLVISAVLLVAVIVINKQKDGIKQSVNRICRDYIAKTYVILIVVAIVAVISNIAMHPSLEMGNFRGYIWYMCFKGYAEGSIKDKLIGVGPGLIDSVTQTQIQKATFSVTWDYWYKTAHNEFIEWFTTTGLIGGLCYAGTIVTSIIRGFKAVVKDNAEMVAATLAGIIGYVAQALVTGPYAMNYALFIIILAIYGVYLRERVGE